MQLVQWSRETPRRRIIPTECNLDRDWTEFEVELAPGPYHCMYDALEHADRAAPVFRGEWRGDQISLEQEVAVRNSFWRDAFWTYIEWSVQCRSIRPQIAADIAQATVGDVWHPHSPIPGDMLHSTQLGVRNVMAGPYRYTAALCLRRE